MDEPRTGVNEWASFFDAHAPDYMTNIFTGNTLAEVDFAVQELGLTPGMAVLDVGCGTGRHSVELARRGCEVTGVDISSGMLREAEKAASAAGVKVEWVHCNAVDYRPRRQFDAAVCLCEGAFALLGSGDDPIEHDLALLRMVNSALRDGGGLLLTTLSALRLVSRSTADDIVSGRFDPYTMTARQEVEVATPSGPARLHERERHYVPTELRLLFRCAGLEVRGLWGGTAGNWCRQQLDCDEIEVMVSAVKVGPPVL